MKIGFQSILYGRRFGDIERALDEIASAGFRGVEFAQSPAMLRRDGVANIQILLGLLRERNLELVGLAGGTLRERMDFCGDPTLLRYLYVEDEDPVWDEVWKRGFKLALHPHLFMRIHRLEDASKLLDKPENQKLLFLPDTAHLALVGDDPVKAIRDYGKRLAAIHLKDWAPEFGRYSHRYARGFVELGKGIVKWDAVFEEIGKRMKTRVDDKDLWLIVELDSSRTSTWTSVRECAQWLSNRPECRFPTPMSEPRSFSTGVFHAPAPPPRVIPMEKELEFRRRLTDASTKGSGTFYHEVARAYHELIPCDLTQIWILTPSEERLDLVGYYADGAQQPVTWNHLDCGPGAAQRPLFASVVDTLEPQAFNLADTSEGSRILDKPLFDHLIKTFDAVGGPSGPVMLSIPVSNTWNSHHLRFVVNLFPKASWLHSLAALENGFAANNSVPALKASLSPLLDELDNLSMAVSPEADSVLDERCLAAAGRIQRFIPSRGASRDAFPKFFVQAVSKSLNSEAAALFRVHSRLNRLEWSASVPERSVWNEHLTAGEQFYEMDENRNTSKAWALGEMRFRATEQRRIEWKSREMTSHPERDDCIFAPIFSLRRREVIGVVRCTNKEMEFNPPGPVATDASRMFTDDDAAVLDAIIQAGRPIFDQLEIQEEQIATLGKIVHEFQFPLVAIRGAADLMNLSFKHGPHKSAKDFFGEDYVDDIFQWTEILGRHVDNADIFRQSYQGNLPIRTSPTLLMSQVIAPAVRQVALLLREYELPAQAIGYDSFSYIPTLDVDRNQMQQVIFNLLSNSIKYAIDRRHFRVTMSGSRMGGSFVIRYADYGPGIDAKYKELIFKPGFRSPDAHERNVSGQGLGLSVVRSIIEAHGGTIEIGKERDPMVFIIRLPQSLAMKSNP